MKVRNGTPEKNPGAIPGGLPCTIFVEMPSGFLGGKKSVTPGGTAEISGRILCGNSSRNAQR